MKLALRLVFWEAMTGIDETIHLVWDKIGDDLPDFISEMLCNFCQWSWGRWNQVVADIIDAYDTKGNNDEMPY